MPLYLIAPKGSSLSGFKHLKQVMSAPRVSTTNTFLVVAL